MNPREIAESWLFAECRNSTEVVKNWLQHEPLDKLISEMINDWDLFYDDIDQPSRDELQDAFSEIQKEIAG